MHLRYSPTLGVDRLTGSRFRQKYASSKSGYERSMRLHQSAPQELIVATKTGNRSGNSVCQGEVGFLVDLASGGIMITAHLERFTSLEAVPPRMRS